MAFAEAMLGFVPNLSAIFSVWNLVCVVITLLYVVWWRRPHGKFPPGPRGVPVLGVVPFLGKCPTKTMKRWSEEKYGDVMSIKIGFENVVILNTYEAVSQAFVKQGATFSDRPFRPILAKLTGNSGIVSMKYGDDFKAQKHFGLRFLREKGIGRKQMEDLVNDEGDRFVEFLRTFGNKPVNMKKYLYWLTSNVISQTALGKRYEYGDPEFVDMLETISMLMTKPILTLFCVDLKSMGDPKDGNKLGLLNIFGRLAYFPPFSLALERLRIRTHKILARIQTHIDDHKENFDPNNVVDFIDAFIFEQRFGKGKGSSAFTENQMKVYTRDLFVAGSETSSSTLSWLFVFCLNFPEYYKIIQDEIDDVFGSDGNPVMSKREALPYTCAFIQEAMRVKTLAPTAAHHCTSETSELMGYVIPKGTTVIPNLEGVHMDSKTWSTPEVFNPRRHIDENEKFVASNKIIPFGIGTRFCLGESLARVEIFVFFVKVLQKFKICSANAQTPSVDNEIRSIVTSPKECLLILEARF